MISNEAGAYRNVHDDVISAVRDAGRARNEHDGPPGEEGVGHGRVRIVRALAAAVVAAVEEGDLVAARATAGVLVACLKAEVDPAVSRAT